jgi:hypothetical protein
MQIDVTPQALPEHTFTLINSPVLTTSRPGVIGMGVRN